MKIPFIFIFFVAYLRFVSAVFKDQSYEVENSIAVYWGQATHKVPQKELSYYCQSSSVDIVILAFVSIFGEQFKVGESEEDGFDLNLSNFCSIDKNGHHVCAQVGEDIRKCQESGKKVLLSLGGEQPEKGRGTYGFSSEKEAVEFGSRLWNYFGEGRDTRFRPFGDALIDGFDIDAENEVQTGYLTLIKHLSLLAEWEGSKKYYFSSAPQCNFPDRSNSALIDGFELDYLFIQFYNNDCKLDSELYNYDEWSRHLLELQHNKTKLFLGLPASKASTENGFVEDTDFIIEKIDEIKNNEVTRSQFGGLMFWDASKGFDPVYRDSIDDSYIYKVWKDLNGLNDPTGATVSNGSDGTSGDMLANHHQSQATVLKPSILLLLIFLIIISHEV